MLKARVLKCLEAGAVATGARLNITPSKYSYRNHVPNRALGKAYRRHFNAIGGEIPYGGLEEYTAVTQASTDQGNVSHVVPSLHANFWIRSEDEEGVQLGGPHTPDFERAARSEDSYVFSLCHAVEFLRSAELTTYPSDTSVPCVWEKP